MATVLSKWTREEVITVIWFLWAQNTEPMNIYRQFVQRVWCKCDVRTTSVEMVRWKSWSRMEVAICHHHNCEWCGWRGVLLNQSELYSSSHAVGFATLVMNMLAIHECAAHNCLTSMCSTECPLQTLPCLARWRGGGLRTRVSDFHLMTLKAEVQKWFWDKYISFCCWDMGNLTVCCGRCLNYVERRGTNVHVLSYALLSTYIF